MSGTEPNQLQRSARKNARKDALRNRSGSGQIRARDLEGRGLGLAIVAEVVAAHHGRVEAHDATAAMRGILDAVAV